MLYNRIVPFERPFFNKLREASGRKDLRNGGDWKDCPLVNPIIFSHTKYAIPASENYLAIFDNSHCQPRRLPVSKRRLRVGIKIFQWVILLRCKDRAGGEQKHDQVS